MIHAARLPNMKDGTQTDASNQEVADREVTADKEVIADSTDRATTLLPVNAAVMLKMNNGILKDVSNLPTTIGRTTSVKE